MKALIPGAVIAVYDNYNALAIGFGASDRVKDVILSLAVMPRWVTLCFTWGVRLPDPDGLLDTDFYDPTGSAIVPPFTAMFNNYVRTDLGYRTDMPYNVFASRTVEAFSKWDWGSAAEGFPNTSTALRQGITKNSYLKILVMEGHYDLATPFYAADYTMDHLDLTPNLRKNISYATYDCGHMVYLRMETLAKMKRDFSGFIDQSIPAQ